MLLRLSIILVVLLQSPWSLGSPFRDAWDDDFKDSVAAFLPTGTDWRLLKAQCYQESRLDPRAVSPVGAQGLCQFMPGTWSSARESLGLRPGDVWLPEASIRAAAWYMGKLHRTWYAPRPPMDRYMLAAASYNAGAGHLIKAQRHCDGQNLYRQIIPCLPRVTGRHAEETINYVESIVGRWYPRLLFD